jgi:hypothetical protein
MCPITIGLLSFHTVCNYQRLTPWVKELWDIDFSIAGAGGGGAWGTWEDLHCQVSIDPVGPTASIHSIINYYYFPSPKGGAHPSGLERFPHQIIAMKKINCTWAQCQKNLSCLRCTIEEGCSARDWDRIRITWGNPQSGCSDICSYSKRATVGVRATYATRWNSGMKRVKCGWTQPLFHKVSNHRFSGRNLKG